MVLQFWALSRYTIHYLIAHRFIQLFGCYVGIFFIVLNFLTTGIVGDYEKVVLDYHCFGFQLYTLLLVFAYTTTFFWHQNNYNLSAYFLINPKTKSFYLYACYTGFIAILLITCLSWYAVSMLSMYYFLGSWHLYLLPLFIIQLSEGILLTSISFFFAQLLPPMATFCATLAFYGVTYLSHTWYIFTQKQPGFFFKTFGLCTSYVIPNLHLLDIKYTFIHPLSLNLWPFIASLVYCLSFSGVFLLAGQYFYKKTSQ